MPALGLPAGTVERSYGGLPTLPIVNLVSERAITEPTQFVLQSRPRLQKYESSAWGGTVPISALHYSERLTQFFVIYGTTLDGPATTTLTDGGLVPSFAENQIGVVATMGAAAKWWDGTAYRSISFPDGANVTKALQSQGRFIFLRAQSQRYYWTEPLANMLDGSGDMIIDGLAYNSAENDQDYLVDGLVWQDRLVLGGPNTIEIHGATGNDDLPWESIIGSTIHKGVVSSGAMAIFDNTFVWVSPDYVVWRYNGSTAERISNSGIEEALKFGTPRLDSFIFEGREFLHVWSEGSNFSVIAGDFMLDASTGEWSEWETGGDVFDGGPSIDINEGYPLFGAKSNSLILGMSNRSVLPGGSFESAPEKRFAAGLAIDGGSVTVNNLLLRCFAKPPDVGTTTGTVSMRYSRDKGQSWSSWTEISLKNNRTEWRSLGMFGQPGALFQFKTASIDEFSVSGASYNEFVQGRTW